MPSRCLGSLGLYAFLVLAVASSCSGASEQDASEPQAGTSGVSGSVGVGGEGNGNGSGTGGLMVALGGRAEGGSGEDPLAACAMATAKAEFVPANFLFVIDTSGSMNCNPPDGDSELGARCARFPIKEDPLRSSKWEVTRKALETALSVLTEKTNVRAGLLLFPRENACGVTAEPSVPIAALGEEQIQAFTQVLDGVDPLGETPIAGATILSYAHLAGRLVDGTLTGNSFVVLLTDGNETCAPDVLAPLLEKDVPNARGFDIRTFVIGAPGSEEARSLLSSMAFEGGTASDGCEHGFEPTAGDCHLDMTNTSDFEGELSAALEGLSSVEALSCEIEVPKNPKGGGVDLNRVNVTFTTEDGDTEQIAQDTVSCADADGWQYAEQYTKIVLCGAACQRVKSASGQLSIVLGCPTFKVR